MEDDPHARRAGRHVHVGVDEIHAARDGAARISVRGDGRRSVNLHRPQVVLEHLRIDPDRREVGDGVEPHVRLNGGARVRLALRDVARGRRVDLDFLPDFSRVFESVDFALRHLPLFQPLDGGVEKRRRARSDAGDCAVRDFLLVLLCDEILALGRDEVGAVDREQRLALPDVLIGGVNEDLLDEAGKTHLDVREAGFIHGDIARRADFDPRCPCAARGHASRRCFAGAAAKSERVRGPVPPTRVARAAAVPCSSRWAAGLPVKWSGRPAATSEGSVQFHLPGAWERHQKKPSAPASRMLPARATKNALR